MPTNYVISSLQIFLLTHDFTVRKKKKGTDSAHKESSFKFDMFEKGRTPTVCIISHEIIESTSEEMEEV